MTDGLFKLTCGALVLCDGTSTGGILEMVDLNGTRLIEEAQFCRADWIEIFDRGNKRNEFTLRWTLVCASLTAATDAWAGFGDDLPGKGDFKLQINANSLTWLGVMSDAGWKNPRAQLSGKTVIFSCSAAGGQIVRTGAGFGGAGTAGAFYATIVSLATGFATLTVSAAGTDTITPGASVGIHTEEIAVTDPGSNFTRKIVLDVAGRTAGNYIAVRIALPLSTHPTIEFHDATSGGTLLETLLADSAKARTYLLTFVFNGTAWLLTSDEESAS